MTISIDEYKSKMENTLKIFHDELNRLRTGRATPSLLEPLFVRVIIAFQLSASGTPSLVLPIFCISGFWHANMKSIKMIIRFTCDSIIDFLNQE